MKTKLIKYLQQEIFIQINLFAGTMIIILLPMMGSESDEREFE